MIKKIDLSQYFSRVVRLALVKGKKWILIIDF